MASFLPVLVSVALGFVISWGTIELSRRWFAGKEESGRGTEFHHKHPSPVPRYGGVGLSMALLAVALGIVLLTSATGPAIYTQAIIVASSLAMFWLGFCDDLRPLSAKAKLAGQVAIAAAVYFAGIQIEVLKNPFTNSEYALGYLSFFATVFWLVALTNLINLIDGIDGLAGGISLMLMCLLAYEGSGAESSFSSLLALGVAGALLGFLYFNFPPAKIYLGDGGAYLLGFLIGILSMVNSQKGSVGAALIAPVFALALPIVDVLFAILRRALKGLPIFRPDRQHIHHRLIDFGFSRERAVIVLYTISLLCLFLAFGVFWSQGRLAALLMGCLFMVLLASAQSVGFMKEWLGSGRRLGPSLALRKETRYALTLAQWLEMEAERHDSVYQLWQDYQFVVKKLGFAEVKLVLPDGTNVWRVGDIEDRPGTLLRARHEIGGGTTIEFAARIEALPEKAFELLCELAAETWHNAAARWQECHQKPVCFVAVASPETSYWTRKLRALSTPWRRRWWRRKAEAQST